MSDFLDRLAQLAWIQTWQIAAVVLAVTLFTRLNPVRRRPHLAYALWLLVLAKCLTPPLWASPTSPFSWALASMASPRAAPPAPIADVITPQDTAAPDLPPPLALPQPEQPHVANGNQWIEADTIPELPVTESPLPASRESVGPVVTPRGWLVLAWILGGMLYFALSLGRYLRARRRLMRSPYGDTAQLDEMISELSRSLRLRRSPRAILAGEPFGPAVLGTLRPVLVVPESTATTLSREQLRLVLAHELVHLRRGDHWMGLVQFVVQALWWFNPLVWWANRELNRVREQCCDEEVLATLHCEPAGYAQTLLDIARLGARSRPLVLTAGVSAMHITGQRLQHIMDDAVCFRRVIPRAYLLAAVAMAFLLLPGAGLALNQKAENGQGIQNVSKQNAAEEGSDNANTSNQRQSLTDNEVSKDNTASQTVTHYPISVSGRALDRTHKPIEGATVFLVAFHPNATEYKPPEVIAQAKTGADGQYVFRRAQLPVTAPRDNRRRERGVFQVIGKAPGYAFAWQGPYGYEIDPPPAVIEPPISNRPSSRKFTPESLKRPFVLNQSIQIDLTFGPAKTINGRLVDEEGKPVEGVQVRIKSCDYVDTAGRDGNARGFSHIDTAGLISMPDQVQVTSDSDGRFLFDSIPPGVMC